MENGGNSMNLFGLIVGLAIFILIVIILVTGYKKAPPDSGIYYLRSA